MSKENVQLFFEQVEKDEQLQEKLKSMQTENQEKAQASIVKLGKESGYDFSAEDLQQVTEEIVASMPKNEELDDSELEAVSGGSGIIIAGFVVTALVGTAVVGIAGIATAAATHGNDGE